MPQIRANYLTRRGPPEATQARVEYAVLDGGISQRWADKQGSEITETCLVRWSDLDDFIRAILPDVKVEKSVGQAFPNTPDDVSTDLANMANKGMLIRYLAEPHPEKPWLAATAAEVVRPIGPLVTTTGKDRVAIQTDPTLSGGAEVRVTYSNLSYNFDVADSVVRGSTEGELLRYVTREVLPGSEFYKLGQSSFKFVGLAGAAAILGQEGPTLVSPLSTLFYTFHMWPVANLPKDLLNSSFDVNTKTTTTGIGLSNRDYWDLNNLATPGSQYIPGRLLMGPPELSEFYFTANGTKVIDFKIPLLFRPSGWFRVFKQTNPGPGYIEVSIDGASYLQFNEATGRPTLAATAAGASKHPVNYFTFTRLLIPYMA